MTLAATPLRPGYLVGLKTSIKGNVSYVKTEVEAEHKTEEGAAKASWETERTIDNPKEHEAATKVRSKARNLLAAVCAQTAFGLLCPENRANELEKAIDDARKLCEDFNETAEITRIDFNAIKGRVSPTDAEAIQAINGEIRELITDMEEGIKSLDVEVVREAATKAKQLGAMLNDSAKATVQGAIDAARKVATKINKAGEKAAAEIDQQALETLRHARTAFLDLEPVTSEVAAPEVVGRAIDLEPTTGQDELKLSDREVENVSGL